MPNLPRVVLGALPGRSFDVVCAGEASGAVNAALALVGERLTVGLATVLENDTFGRGLREKVTAAGVDTEGVAFAEPTSGLFFVRGGARQVLPLKDQEQPVTVPEGWSSQVLLLSGMSPVVSHAGAMCKAARAARRAGTIVVVDVNARWDLWKGQDARTIRMVLREADVVWCSMEDLLGINMDVATLRAELRRNAVLAVNDGNGRALALGPFGEITRSPKEPVPFTPGRGPAFVTAICGELARAGKLDERSGELWTRALDQGLDIGGGPQSPTARRSRLA